MNKNLQAFAIIFLGMCILLGSIILSKAIDNNKVESSTIDTTYVGGLQEQNEQQDSQGRYEFIPLASDYYVVFDTHTGDFWKKIDGQEWIKQEAPQK